MPAAVLIAKKTANSTKKYLGAVGLCMPGDQGVVLTDSPYEFDSRGRGSTTGSKSINQNATKTKPSGGGLEIICGAGFFLLRVSPSLGRAYLGRVIKHTGHKVSDPPKGYQNVGSCERRQSA